MKKPRSKNKMNKRASGARSGTNSRPPWAEVEGLQRWEADGVPFELMIKGHAPSALIDASGGHWGPVPHAEHFEDAARLGVRRESR